MRNPTYESALTRQGVTFTYHDSIDLVDIDTAKGIRNQARLVNPLEEELVESYAAAYKDDCEFPPVVLWRPGKGRWIPIDGNNRLAACAKAGKKWHDAYTVEIADQQIIDRLTWTFNNLVNGKRLSREECVEHAVSFVLKYGYTCERAAAEWGVPKWVVTRNTKASKVRDRLQTNGVKITPALTDEVLHRLSTLEQVGEDLLAAVATVVSQSGVGVEGCEQIVKDVKAARTHEAKVKAVDDFAKSEFVRQKQAETKGGRVKSPTPLPRVQLSRLLTQVQRLLENYTDPAALRAPRVDYKEARTVALDVVQRLTVLYGLGVIPQEVVG